MRVFYDFSSALWEIRRDLYKAPAQTSTWVQGIQADLVGHEALNYGYSVPGEAFAREGIGRPAEFTAFIANLQDPETKQCLFPMWLKHQAEIADWLSMQKDYRTRLFPSKSALESDIHHPGLSKVLEGGAFAYSYPERMHGAAAVLAAQLIDRPDTRRAYWPMFDRGDSIRSVLETRVPCTIGYHALIRPTPQGPRLHLTYLQRSCDFHTFWPSDLYLAYALQHEIFEDVSVMQPDLLLGQIFHHVISFHFFENAEIY